MEYEFSESSSSSKCFVVNANAHRIKELALEKGLVLQWLFIRLKK